MRQTCPRLRYALAGLLGAAAVLSVPSALAQEPGVTADSIKIGVFGPLTGQTSLYGYPIVNGALAVYNEVNANGGIHGRKLDVVVEDDVCAPDRAMATVRRLVDRENVFALHGGSCSGSTLAIKDFVIESATPMVVLAAGARSLVEPVNPYLFTITQDLPSQSRTLLEYVLSMPDTKKIAIVQHPDEWGNEQTVPFLAGLKAAGIEPVAVEVLDRYASDATAQIQRVRSAGANVVALFAQPGETAVFLRDAHRYGYSPTTFGTGGGMDLHDLAKRAGGYDVIKNYRVVSYLKGYLGSSEIAEGEALYRKWFPGTDPLAITFIGMGGARVLVEALKRVGPDLTRAKLLAAMESLTDYDNGVNSCLFSYSSTDHIGCESGTIWKIRDEKIVTLAPTWRAEHDAD